MPFSAVRDLTMTCLRQCSSDSAPHKVKTRKVTKSVLEIIYCLESNLVLAPHLFLYSTVVFGKLNVLWTFNTDQIVLKGYFVNFLNFFYILFS